MTDQIKVSEVSAILREQLEGINTTIHLEEVGTVLQVSDGGSTYLQAGQCRSQ